MPSLADLSPGQIALVDDITGEDAICSRLFEMGITPGEQVEMIGRAPMGDPIEISIRGYRLSLRVVEAARVLVAEPTNRKPIG